MLREELGKKLFKAMVEVEIKNQTNPYISVNEADKYWDSASSNEKEHYSEYADHFIQSIGFLPLSSSTTITDELLGAINNTSQDVRMRLYKFLHDAHNCRM